jgi:hypothetical protein
VNTIFLETYYILRILSDTNHRYSIINVKWFFWSIICLHFYVNLIIFHPLLYCHSVIIQVISKVRFYLFQATWCLLLVSALGRLVCFQFTPAFQISNLQATMCWQGTRTQFLSSAFGGLLLLHSYTFSDLMLLVWFLVRLGFEFMALQFARHRLYPLRQASRVLPLI